MQNARFLCLVFIFCSPLFAKATRFEVKDVAFRNLVQFTSDALLEKTVGHSHFLSGWVELDPQNVKSGIKGEFEVDMRSFEMGPEPRQAKWRETLLNVQEFPGASYKVDKVVQVSTNELANGKAVNAKVSGILNLRGITRRQEMQVKLTYLPESEMTRRRASGNLLKMAASFDISLSEIKYVLPEALKGLVSNTFRITADAVGTDQLPVSPP